MDIADVVKRSGVPASTLRFYEEKGLVAATGRHAEHRSREMGSTGMCVPGVSRPCL